MTGWASPWHIAIFALVVVLVFGTKRLPEIGRSVGTGMREFKRSITSHEKEPTRQQISAAATEVPVDRRERDAI